MIKFEVGQRFHCPSDGNIFEIIEIKGENKKEKKKEMLDVKFTNSKTKTKASYLAEHIAKDIENGIFVLERIFV